MPRHTIHVISHTHWDREWYLPFERHRRRLVALLDALLDLMDGDPQFKHFHLDGQVIPLEDYLEIRPQQRERIVRAIREGRMSVGPWYVLQDEFLTSGEANVRNLLVGLRKAREWGEPIRLGYLPDSFGNLSQMPQILCGFGIDNAVFGRGVNPWREEVDPDDEPEARGFKSELCWRAPDGSEVLGIFMANWYANAMEIPTDPDRIVEYVERVRAACARYATTSHLLFMNGCDHTPSQPDVSTAIRIANETIDDIEMVHSNFADYIAAVRSEAPDLQVIEGELRSEHTNGWGTLANTLSSRIYLKQANWRCQTLLERWVEPFSAFAQQQGGEYDRDLIRYAWTTLMQNHPHDSICGCSCDEVHREMETRFGKCEVLGEQLADEALAHLARQVKIDGTKDEGKEAAAADPARNASPATVVVFNPINLARREVVWGTVDFPADCELAGVVVRDGDGRPVPSRLEEDLGVVWDYELPEVGFRVPYHTRRVRIAFLADVPPVGYAAYQVLPSSDAESELEEAAALENEFLRVEVGEDGRLAVTDRQTGVTFEGLHLLQDSLDAGDEYNYRAPQADEIAVPPPAATRVTAMAHSPLYSCCRVTTGLTLRGETQQVIYELWLFRGSRRLEVYLDLTNRIPNHRLRVLFPTGVEAGLASADGQFEVVRRRIVPWKGWTNPSNCQPQQAFVDVSDGDQGLTIANRGLPEYEILRDGRNTIALTLLRAVGELGDWGVFPTPDAQCRRSFTFEYALIPHAGALEGSHADREARAFNAPLRAVQARRSEGRLPPRGAFLDLQPSALFLSAVKQAEDRNGLIVRFYNPYAGPQTATLKTLCPVRRAYLCTLSEERQRELKVERGEVKLEVGGKKIVTVEVI